MSTRTDAPRRVRGTSVRDALEGAVTAIGAAGCETPRLDGEVLLAHVLGVGRERLLLDRELLVAGAAVRAYQDAVGVARCCASRSRTSPAAEASARSSLRSTRAR